METNTEISLLEKAIKNNCPLEEIEGLCKRIIKDRILAATPYDPLMQDAILNLIEVFSFPVKTQLALSHRNKGDNNNLNKMFISSVTGCLGFSMLLLKSPLVRFIGGILCVGSGFGLKSVFTETPKTSSTRLACASTASELMQSIDAIYEKLQVIFNHNQLEGRHKDVLVWLQRLFSDDDDGKYRVEFLKLMNVLGYEFVEYSDDVSENFEESDANVSEIVTSKYAVRNKATGRFVLPGVVVYPRKGK